MRLFSTTFAILLVSMPVLGQDLPEATFYVDAAAAPGGTGTRKNPYARIADAVDAGRPLAATYDVTIKVAPGDYLSEPRPLLFDYRVNLKGPTVLARDVNGIATGGFENAATVRGVAANQIMLLIRGDGVTIRGLALHGFDGPPSLTTNRRAIAVDKSADFTIEDVHITGADNAIFASASTGKIQDSYLGPPLSAALGVAGGNGEHPTDVRVIRNRIVDYSDGGIAVIGAGDQIPPTREPFHTTAATLEGNVLSTVGPLAGPSNPFGLRFNPIYSPISDEEGAAITARVKGNVVSGKHRYPLIVNAGQIARNDKPYHATLDLTFEDNQWEADPGGGTVSRIIISFTNSRMGIYPFWNELSTSWKYLEASTYRLRHRGELDACLAGFSPDCHVDHPEIEPCDGRVLGNVLEISGFDGPLPYGTFIDPETCP